MELSKKDRWILSNQLRILEALYPAAANSYSIQREILESGYTLLYDIELPHITDEEEVLSIDECKEVWNTLDMFDAIDRSISKHNFRNVPKNALRKFRGYDGNHETQFMAFTRFTVERLQRFTYVDVDKTNKHEKLDLFNSHTVMRPRYQKMLDTWLHLLDDNRFDMSVSSLTHVLNSSLPSKDL